jgi:glycosyltransferase involved in cell wall biosynthesis
MFPTITFFFRKPRTGAFSIEKLFLNIQKEFPSSVRFTNYYLSRHSSGLLNRVKLIWEAFQKMEGINHITGDVNFIVLLLPKHKTVLTIHDIESLHRPNRVSNFLLQFFWLRMPISRVKYVTVVSHATKNKLLSLLSVNPDKVVVIPNVISPDFSYQCKNFNVANIIILQVGTKYNKNIERTIEALYEIPCTLVIVGKLSVHQKQLLDKYSIRYVNHVDIIDEQLRELYVQADIVTFVSLFEGFGMPILEAQATGRPVLTSNCSSMPEVAGEGALFVDPSNIKEIRQGILKLIKDEKLRDSLIAKGLENCKRFSIKAVAQHYLDLYNRL